MFRKLGHLMNRQRLFRRIVLFWAMGVISYVVYVVIEPGLLIAIGAAGATIVSAVIGILATVISFYQWHRQQEDMKNVEKPDE